MATEVRVNGRAKITLYGKIVLVIWFVVVGLFAYFHHDEKVFQFFCIYSLLTGGVVGVGIWAMSRYERNKLKNIGGDSSDRE